MYKLQDIRVVGEYLDGRGLQQLLCEGGSFRQADEPRRERVRSRHARIVLQVGQVLQEPLHLSLSGQREHHRLNVVVVEGDLDGNAVRHWTEQAPEGHEEILPASEADSDQDAGAAAASRGVVEETVTRVPHKELPPVGRRELRRGAGLPLGSSEASKKERYYWHAEKGEHGAGEHNALEGTTNDRPKESRYRTHPVTST